MGVLGLLFGSFVGVSTVTVANWIRLQPAMRAPWYHLGGLLLGGYGGYKYEGWRNKQLLYFDEAVASLQAKQDALDMTNEELDSTWRSKHTTA